MTIIVVEQQEYTIEGPVTVWIKQSKNENVEIKVHALNSLFSVEERVLHYSGIHCDEAARVTVAVMLPRHRHVSFDLTLKGIRGIVVFGKMIFSDMTTLRFVDLVCARVNISHLHVFSVEVSCEKPVFIRDCNVLGTVTCRSEKRNVLCLSKVRMNHLALLTPETRVYLSGCFFVTAEITAKLFFTQGPPMEFDDSTNQMGEITGGVVENKERVSGSLVLVMDSYDSRVTIASLCCHQVEIRYKHLVNLKAKRTLLKDCKIDILMV